MADLPLTRFQAAVIAVMILLNALDGYDALAIAFAAPGIARNWSATPGELGIVISVGLFGTAFGSLCVAPLGDRIGRRPMILSSLAAMTVGMGVTAVAPGLIVLSLGRLLTGVGVGAMVPSISALAAEYSNHRLRNLVVMLVAIGFPVGGLLCGSTSTLLLHHFDWRSVFIAGAVITGLTVLAPLLLVPESVEFLAMVRSSSSLAKINAIRTRLQQPPLIALPPLPERLSRRNVFDIFLPALLLTTLTLTLAYGLHSATVYYALNWVPKLVVDLSFSASQGATVSAWTSAGGIVGALIVAALTARVDVGRLTTLLLFGTAAFLMVFAHTAANLHQLIATSALLGACLYGGQASLYALMTRAFPTHVRATGVGFVTGVGRLGGILSPSVSGFLMGAGLQNSQVSTVMALGSLSGAVILVGAGALGWSGMRASRQD
jgi:benzoate transport